MPWRDFRCAAASWYSRCGYWRRSRSWPYRTGWATTPTTTCRFREPTVSRPPTPSQARSRRSRAAVSLTFRSGTVAARLLPIVTAIFALLSTLASIRMLGHVTSVPTVAPTLATMIGLGVGIDYALFIVTRHFRGLREGLPIEESIARAAATSGGAVFFAGCTVTIALVSLAVAGIPLVTTMGLMAAVAVVIAVLAALTLLPAELAIMGPRIQSLRVHKPATDEHIRKGLWAKWAREIARRPIVAGIAALAILIPLMIPLLSLQLGQQDTAALSKSTTARQAYDLISQNFGAGVNGPLLVAVKLGSPAQNGTQDPRLATLQKDVKGTSGVVAVSPAQVDQAGTTAYFNAISYAVFCLKKKTNLVHTLRLITIPTAPKVTHMHAYVG